MCGLNVKNLGDIIYNKCDKGLFCISDTIINYF